MQNETCSGAYTVGFVSAEEAEMATQLTFGEFVKQLALRMEAEKIAMLFDDETAWHLLFYRLYKQKQSRKTGPTFFERLAFDWDGPNPTCPQLSDYLRALHVTGSVGVVNPSFEHLDINPDVREIWKQASHHLDKKTDEFLTYAVKIAKEEFNRKTVA
jgi:hypothetical protein